MRLLCSLLLVLFCVSLTPAQSQTLLAMSSQSTRMLEQRYLREARAYRAEGRYELARQSYVLALSICTNTKRLEIIRHELDGLELLLRTLR
ncbi:MAG: hypothetical protein IJS54_05330 [Desulfovibrio sp.]|nr:hypothetical protein [Desulfovibrio sp.]